jgi:exosome complex exonuclease RRP6
MSDPPAPTAFDALHSSITAALLATTRAATALAAEDLRFHRSLDAGVASALDAQQGRILTLAERLLASAARGTGAAAPPRLADVEALEEGWAGVVDVVDGELERADVAMEGMAGVVRRGGEAVEQQTEEVARGRVQRNLDIPKPQLLFEVPPDNRSEEPFRPLLTAKPHAIVPLEESLSHTETNGYGSLE